MNRNDNTPKLTADHLARKAYGFQQVEIVDGDLGRSAAIAAPTREGFKGLSSSVALGEVGLVLGGEVSRLSRTDQDGCQLIELCQLFNTLIADAQNLYDLNRLDDRRVLGIKGTLSVVELKTLALRLQQGREAKAKRGELGRCLAPGYVTDPLGQILKDPNLRIQEAMALVFKQFHRLGSIRQTHRGFHEERVELPVNKTLGGQFQLVWQLPSLSFVSDVLHNPLYAGAYVYGRRPSEVVVKDGQPRKRQRSPQPAEAASVFIPDHHPGYISWAQYQRNQDIMRRNGSNFHQSATCRALPSSSNFSNTVCSACTTASSLLITHWPRSSRS